MRVAGAGSSCINEKYNREEFIMACNINAQNNHGPVFVCGASAMWMNHQPGEPAPAESMVNAIKGFFGGKSGESVRGVAEQGAVAHGIAG